MEAQTFFVPAADAQGLSLLPGGLSPMIAADVVHPTLRPGDVLLKIGDRWSAGVAIGEVQQWISAGEGALMFHRPPRQGNTSDQTGPLSAVASMPAIGASPLEVSEFDLRSAPSAPPAPAEFLVSHDLPDLQLPVSPWRCPACLKETNLSDVRFLAECGCGVCEDCFQYAVRLTRPCCPSSSCGRELSSADVARASVEPVAAAAAPRMGSGQFACDGCGMGSSLGETLFLESCGHGLCPSCATTGSSVCPVTGCHAQAPVAAAHGADATYPCILCGSARSISELEVLDCQHKVRVNAPVRVNHPQVCVGECALRLVGGPDFDVTAEVVCPQCQAPVAQTTVQVVVGPDVWARACEEAALREARRLDGDVATAAAAEEPAPKPGDAFETEAVAMWEAIGRSYDLKVVQCVLRHHPQAGNPEAVIETLLSGIDAAEWLEKDQQLTRLPSAETLCAICQDSAKVADMFTLDCPASHRFCYECIRGWIEARVGEGAVVLCPFLVGSEQCGHRISEVEVEQVCGQGDTLERFKTLELSRAIRQPDTVACPAVGCSNWIVASTPDVKERVECECGQVFCSVCRHPYHYALQCRELPEAVATWMEWIATGRATYKAQQAARYEADRREYRKAEAAHKKEQQAALARYKELQKDEEWLAQNAKRCPSCGRAVQKISGCDSMICGRDAHGGNAQDGCGHSFNYSSAPAYEPAAGDPKVREFALNPPSMLTGVRHRLFRCDECHGPIVGLRFSCLNCACFNLCVQRGSSAHGSGHVFRIIVTEETELDPEVARLMDADADAAAAEPVVQMAVEDPAAQGGSWWQWMFGGQHIGGAQQAE